MLLLFCGLLDVLGLVVDLPNGLVALDGDGGRVDRVVVNGLFEGVDVVRVGGV
jgi:hypothetical protein